MTQQSAFAPGKCVGASRFTLARQLGRGGMGVVWQARDERLGEDVALKFLPAEIRADQLGLEDLRRETLRSRRLSHPHIVRIYDLHEQEGEAPFISMELVEGRDLVGLRIEERQPVFRWTQLQPWVRQLCEALDYAHGQKVIHRDLKPSNLILDRHGQLKLADFGIAAVMSDSLSRVTGHRTSGTLAYMSPQHFEGRAPQVGDDIYSLGATLYELLTGRPPFYTGDVGHQILQVPATPLEERLAELGVANEIPPAVRALVLACLAKDPVQRPSSARAVAEWIGLPATPPDRSETPSEESDPQPAPESAQDVGTNDEQPAVSGASKRRRLCAGAATVAAVVFVLGWLGWREHGAKLRSSLIAKAGDESVALFDGSLRGWRTRPAGEGLNLWGVGAACLAPTDSRKLAVSLERSELINNAAKKGESLDLYSDYLHGDAVVSLEVLIPEASNSGIFLMGEYEVQVLDSYGHDHDAGLMDMGAIHNTRAPSEPKYLAPGLWNRFEIHWQAPRFNANGTKTSNARFLRVVLNGRIIHENIEMTRPTIGGLDGQEKPAGPLMLQGSYGPVAYRDIRISPLAQ